MQSHFEEHCRLVLFSFVPATVAFPHAQVFSTLVELSVFLLKLNVFTILKKIVDKPGLWWLQVCLEEGQWGSLTEDKNWKACVHKSRNGRCCYLATHS